jgi:hypothetical protein
MATLVATLYEGGRAFSTRVGVCAALAFVGAGLKPAPTGKSHAPNVLPRKKKKGGGLGSPPPEEATVISD